MIYDNLKKNTNNIKPIENKVIHHFVQGPYVEIKVDTITLQLCFFLNSLTYGNQAKLSPKALESNEI